MGTNGELDVSNTRSSLMVGPREGGQENRWMQRNGSDVPTGRRSSVAGRRIQTARPRLLATEDRRPTLVAPYSTGP